MALKYKDRVKVINGFYKDCIGIVIVEDKSSGSLMYYKYLIALDDGNSIEEELRNLEKIDLNF